MIPHGPWKRSKRCSSSWGRTKGHSLGKGGGSALVRGLRRGRPGSGRRNQASGGLVTWLFGESFFRLEGSKISLWTGSYEMAWVHCTCYDVHIEEGLTRVKNLPVKLTLLFLGPLPMPIHRRNSWTRRRSPGTVWSSVTINLMFSMVSLITVSTFYRPAKRLYFKI